MKQFSKIVFRLLSLVALTVVTFSNAFALGTEVNVVEDGILYFCYYEGDKENAVADYAFSSSPINQEEERAYTIQSTVDYELKWKEKGPDGNLVEKTKILSFKVTEISNSAFSNSKLTSISIPNTIETIGSGAFENCVNLKYISLPPSVKEIGGSMCKGCTSLSEIKLNTTITEIPGDAFYGCTSLHEVVMTSGVKKIGVGAFQNCTTLTGVDLGLVEIIGTSAFANCTRLTSITFPISVKLIDIYAFYGCPLEEIHLKHCTPPLNSMAFEAKCWEKTTVYIPGCRDNYYKEKKYGWSNFKHIVVLEPMF